MHQQSISSTGDSVPSLTLGIQPTSTLSVSLVPWLYTPPDWYPDSVHYVRQWWPTLPGVPAMCNAVTLVLREDILHSPRYVLRQHYFYAGLSEPKSQDTRESKNTKLEDAAQGSQKLAMSYVDPPFCVACTRSTRNDPTGDDDDDDDDSTEVPLIATDFGHAVWIEHIPHPDGVSEHLGYWGMRLQFVTFPPVSSMWAQPEETPTRLTVQTLDVPVELNLYDVNNICLDQAQGTVTLSVKEGKIFVLYYE